MTQRKKAFLRVEGMHCGSCAVAINMFLTNKRGVFEANVDFDAKKAEIDYDPEEVRISDLVEGLEGMGYPATEHQNGGRVKSSR